MKNLTIILSFLLLSISSTFAQVKGEEPAEFNPDTVFVFQSPRDLINPVHSGTSLQSAWGIDLLFSGSGFGAGLFYNANITEKLVFLSSLYISGARNTDEFEYYVWDEAAGQYKILVLGKVNRLYVLPLTVGLQYYLFSGELTESFKPYANIGFGPSLILSTPYSKEFFSSWSSADAYLRFGAFLGVGAYVSANSKTLMGLNARYYYIPFGGKGLESIKDKPLTNFGGVFLSLSIGIRF